MKTLSELDNRWCKSVARAYMAISGLLEIQEEYQNWRDAFREGLESQLADKLDIICESDLGSPQRSMQRAYLNALKRT